MKRLIGGMVALSLVTIILVAPTPAFAGSGHFWGGFAVGAVTGVILGNAFAPPVYYAPPPVVYQPAPVYYYPAPVYYPATTCYDYWVNGYWYYGSWVAGHWERACR